MREDNAVTMRPIRPLILLAIILLLGECSTVKKRSDVPHHRGRDIIRTAINDFTSKERSLKRSSDVFSVVVHDSIYRMVLEETTEGVEKWLVGKFYPDLIAVDIIAYGGKFIYSDSLFQSKKLNGLPNRYLEVSGKLFYWTDGLEHPTQEVVDVLSKYDLLVSHDLDGITDFYNTPISDDQKGVHYYYCRDKSTLFKKVVTDRALGYYEVPKTPCES